MQLKPKNTVHITVQDYRDGKRQPAKCRTLIGTTAEEFLRRLDEIAGGPTPESALKKPAPLAAGQHA